MDKRLIASTVAAGLLFAACGSSAGDSSGVTQGGGAQNDGTAPASVAGAFDTVDESWVDLVSYSETAAVGVAVEQVPPAGRDDSEPSGLATFQSPTDALPAPSIDLSVLRSGGPGPDGIPSIDAPRFHDASSVDYLAESDPVVALEVNGDARAYPLDILIWHELVNDTVGGVPVSVAYCPLCNSVTVYEREIDGRVLEFGVSGLLFNSSLVMFDRQTETLWSHFSGQPLYGALSDAELVSIPATTVGFGTWRAEHPDGLVLNRDTGISRNYGSNPYPGYDDIDSTPFLFEGEVDGRYTAMTRVVGVQNEAGTESVAFPLLELRDAGVVEAVLGGSDVVAFWVPGAASALDGEQVSGGVDVGSTGVFFPNFDGQRLTFASAHDADGTTRITDAETGSTWNIFGEATSGELAGSTLEQLIHIDTFWFAWIAFHPDATIAT